MNDGHIKENESARVGSTIELDVGVLVGMKRDRDNIGRMLSQAQADNNKAKAQLEKLIRQATDSKA